MNKKLLIIIISVIAIVVVASLAVKFLGEELTSSIGESPTGEKSIMELAAEQDNEIIKEKEWIKGCEESDPEDRDDCYVAGAVYYRNTSLCKNIKDSSIREKCKGNVEEYYKELKEMAERMKKMSPEEREQMDKYYEQIQQGIIPGTMPYPVGFPYPGGAPYIPGVGVGEGDTGEQDAGGEDTGEEIIGGGGGGATEDIYEITEQRNREMEQAMGKVSDDVKVEIGALMFYYMYFISEEGMYTPRGMKAMEKVQEIQDKNNIDDDTVSQIPIDVQNDPILLERAMKRYDELLEKGI